MGDGAEAAGATAASRFGRSACSAAATRGAARRGVDLVYGGGGIGLMGLIARMVLDGGRRVVGVIRRALMAVEYFGRPGRQERQAEQRWAEGGGRHRPPHLCAFDSADRLLSSSHTAVVAPSSPSRRPPPLLFSRRRRRVGRLSPPLPPPPLHRRPPLSPLLPRPLERIGREEKKKRKEKRGDHTIFSHLHVDPIYLFIFSN
uniref:Cytokinin riboside 5'-monophosphate phosphoribohydrolase n=1 Tax=Oryza meridionalis TaxID=40149 RepID=A0A0E0DHS6_9ORYZ